MAKSSGKPRLLTTTELARIIDVTPTYIRTLTSKGVINRARDTEGNEIMGRFNLIAVRDYIRHLRGLLRKGDTSEEKWAILRNERMEAEAEMAKLKLRQIKGELHSAADVEFVITNMLTYFKQGILAIPSRVARLCVGKKFRDILTILTTEIHLVLNKLSGYNPADFAAQRAKYLESRGVNLNGEGEQSDDTNETVTKTE